LDFELSDEQRLFRQTLREFADKEIMPVAPEWEAAGRYPAEIVGRLRALESMRIHGGYGYSAEFVVERLYRDAPLMAIGEGTNDVQRLVIASSLVSGAGRLGW
jgi:alkylation response protein AidB-like acyl-CoA dehydrogenase